MTMNLIQHIELGSAASSISFSSIPQDGTDLLIVTSLRGDSGSHPGALVRLNSSTSNYSNRRLYGSGTSAASDSTAVGTDKIALMTIPGSSQTASTFHNASIYLPNYALTAAKSASYDSVEETNATEAYGIIGAGLLTDTAAISSITISINSGNFVAGSSATLYKITKGSDGTTTVS